MKAWLALGAVTVGCWVLDHDAFAADASKAEAAKTVAAKSDVSKADASKSDVAKSDAVKSNTAKSDAVKSDAAKKSGPLKSPVRHGRTAMRTAPTIKAPREKAKAQCFHDAVTVVHFTEEDTFPLTRCDGSVAHLAVERLSVLARPGSAAKPQVDPSDLAKVKSDRIAPGIRRIDPKLVGRIQALVDHFSKGKPARLQIISGYRPASAGSYHSTGRALDVRLEGVSNEALVSFCKTLPDTGCGYYPNSSFIHVDVREPGTGHVAWIDASGPGEAPRYVSSWPPPPSSSPNTAPEDVTPNTVEDALSKLERGLAPLPADEHTPVAKDGKEPAKEDDGEPEPTVPSKHAERTPPAAAEKSAGSVRFQL